MLVSLSYRLNSKSCAIRTAFTVKDYGGEFCEVCPQKRSILALNSPVYILSSLSASAERDIGTLRTPSQKPDPKNYPISKNMEESPRTCELVVE